MQIPSSISVLRATIVAVVMFGGGWVGGSKYKPAPAPTVPCVALEPVDPAVEAERRRLKMEQARESAKGIDRALNKWGKN
jgi:hypothetical protein